MDQVLQDMENLDLDVTDETGAATAGDGTDATASGEESSGTESPVSYTHLFVRILKEQEQTVRQKTSLREEDWDLFFCLLYTSPV